MRVFFLPIVLLSVVILSACSGGASATLKPNKAGFEQAIEYYSLQIRSKLGITAVRQRQVGDLLQVSVDLQNRWDQALAFQYQFHFYDKDGFEVSPESRPWTAVTISGKQTQTVQATAPNPSAVTFKIMVKD